MLQSSWEKGDDICGPQKSKEKPRRNFNTMPEQSQIKNELLAQPTAGPISGPSRLLAVAAGQSEME